MDYLEILMKLFYYYKLIIFTNNETYQLIKNYKKIYPNIKFIIKEFYEFEYFQFKDIFEKQCQYVKFFTTFEYVLLNMNQHILIEKISEIKDYQYYSFINIECVKDLKDKNPYILRLLNIEKYYFYSNEIYTYIIPKKYKNEFLKQYNDIFYQQNIINDKDIIAKIMEENLDKCEFMNKCIVFEELKS
jgi:hypothetical protein